MFNVDSRLHRSPYEELQSINLDGTIVGLKYPTNHWNELDTNSHEGGNQILSLFKCQLITRNEQL